jgi:predicted TIM-barrel fold metal-dependent hydrolase
MDGTALDPQRPIIDPHHHLWDPGLPVVPPFLVGDMAATIEASGHNIIQTVFLECHAMYRQDGPNALKPVGEVEFANGMAAMSASGRYGPCRIAAAIVGGADLRLGSQVAAVLDAHKAATPERFRGIRVSVAYAPDGLFGGPPDHSIKGIMMDSRFREGVEAVRDSGLTLDIWCLHTQLSEFADLADAFPSMMLILDHLGTPMFPKAGADTDGSIFAAWREGIRDVAQRPNVLIKVGGLGMDLHSFGTPSPPRSSAELAAAWEPYVESAIEAFGAQRCMFESNYPPDGVAGSYGQLWNAFKIITEQYSDPEKDRLFRATATEAYRLPMG